MDVRRAFLILLLLTAHAHGGQNAAAPGPTRLDYHADVQPIFERRCQPCHFPGGKMYAMLPFDDGRTIVKLDTKLFTRIKDERDRTVIRAFLAQTRTK